MEVAFITWVWYLKRIYTTVYISAPTDLTRDGPLKLIRKGRTQDHEHFDQTINDIKQQNDVPPDSLQTIMETKS